MAARGAYRKGIEKREEILRLALEVLAREGYRGTTVRDLADAVGLSQTGLLHYFGSKDELLTAVLRRRDEIDSEDEEGLSVAERLIRTLRHNATVPGLVMLYAQLSVEAAAPEHPAHEYFQERFATLRREIADLIRAGQGDGSMPATLDPERTATMALALSDGLQVQWLYEPGLDMAAHVEHLWELIVASAPGATS
ncbi:TetR/AcrR family transcriptional regulator [Actinotalea caeni]|uniref:TetR/AcrR family transcriptional regulator n=1 Tax=Actinotalea caeni TaxID=1348467 RepID=UPI001878C555|nr:TetR/AcrR family transcriptional regulator [Actinotalea caeni]